MILLTVAPKISIPMEGQEFNITEGSNGSVRCTATGYPVPTVVWQNRDGSSLDNDDNINDDDYDDDDDDDDYDYDYDDVRLVSGSPVISSTGVGNVTSVSVELMIIGTMRVDTGVYRCSVTNSVSNVTRSIIITILCKLVIQ